MSTPSSLFIFFFFFNYTATTEIYTLSLHDALPIFPVLVIVRFFGNRRGGLRARAFDEFLGAAPRSEEHTSEPQSPVHLVCRLLLEKKNEVVFNAVKGDIDGNTILNAKGP